MLLLVAALDGFSIESNILSNEEAIHEQVVKRATVAHRESASRQNISIVLK